MWRTLLWWLYLLDVAENEWLLWPSRYWRSGETISEHAARAQVHGRKWGCRLCRVLHKIDPGHCTSLMREGK